MKRTYYIMVFYRILKNFMFYQCFLISNINISVTVCLSPLSFIYSLSLLYLQTLLICRVERKDWKKRLWYSILPICSINFAGGKNRQKIWYGAILLRWENWNLRSLSGFRVIVGFKRRVSYYAWSFSWKSIFYIYTNYIFSFANISLIDK